jgi:hypothetical protein
MLTQKDKAALEAAEDAGYLIDRSSLNRWDAYNVW